MADQIPNAASRKDFAEYFLLSLQMHRCSVFDVVAWADSVIETSAEAPEWAIDLAYSKSAPVDAVLSLLRHVPGEVTDDLPRKMLSATIGADWLSQRLSDEEFIEQWYVLYPEYPMEGDLGRHAAEIWQYLDNVFLCIHSGEKIPVTLHEARNHLKQLLEPYSRYRHLIRHSG